MKKHFPRLHRFLRTLFPKRTKELPPLPENPVVKENRFVLRKADGTEINHPQIDGLKVTFLGKNNIVELYEPLPRFINCNIALRDEATFIMHESTPQHVVRDMTVWKMRRRSKIEIGKFFTCVGVGFAMHCEDDLHVTIGDDCMFSHDVHIQPSDSHSIIDLDTKKALNFGKDIVIGNHVWIAPDAFILKGSVIPDNCVIGAISVVSKPLFESNAVYVGNPVRMIRKNITWDRSSAQDYERRMSRGC